MRPTTEMRPSCQTCNKNHTSASSPRAPLYPESTQIPPEPDLALTGLWLRRAALPRWGEGLGRNNTHQSWSQQVSPVTPTAALRCHAGLINSDLNAPKSIRTSRSLTVEEESPPHSRKLAWRSYLSPSFLRAKSEILLDSSFLRTFHPGRH